MVEKNYITSGRNTLIHKNRKFDLLIVNGDHPVVVVTHKGLSIYNGIMPNKKAEAKKAYQDVVNISNAECFGEEKTLVFVQALDNKEYKIDYSKIDTPAFIKVHQESFF